MSAISNPAQVLVDFWPRRSFFVGIDSDGCAFDAMELKQKECFIPNTIRVWGLQPIAQYARATAEWVNLYSKWRGANRWPALVKVFALLAELPEVQARGAQVFEGKALQAFVASGYAPSETRLKACIAAGHPDEELSWQRFYEEASDKFLDGTYAGAYQASLIAEFEKLLPEMPPWQKLTRVEWDD